MKADKNKKVKPFRLINYGGGTDCFFLCPSCNQRLNYMFKADCQKCGQAIDWENYDKIPFTDSRRNIVRIE